MATWKPRTKTVEGGRQLHLLLLTADQLRFERRNSIATLWLSQRYGYLLASTYNLDVYQQCAVPQ